MTKATVSNREAVKAGTPARADASTGSCFFATASTLETVYSRSTFVDPFLAEYSQTTGYTLVCAQVKQMPTVRPKLPLGLENLLVAWRHGTGEIAEGPIYTRIYLSLIEPAEFGTRYDFVTTLELPREPVARVPTRTRWLVEARSNPAEQLRELTGLPIEELADIFGVSRVTYYNWIADRPIALDNERRLYAVLKVLSQVSKMRGFGPNELRRWLLTPIGTEGMTPLKLVGSGDDQTVSALALRAGRPDAWTPLLSHRAIEGSGIPRSQLRRVGSRGWLPESKVPSLEERLEQLKPSTLPEPDDVDERPDVIEEGRGIYLP